MKKTHWSLSGRVAEILGDLGCIEQLLKLTSDKELPPETRIIAFVELAKFGRIDELLALGSDRTVQQSMRLEAAVALGRIGHTQEAAQICLSLMGNESVDIKMQIQSAKVLGKVGLNSKAVPFLLNLASNYNVRTTMRMRSIQALGSLECFNELLELAQDGRMKFAIRLCAAKTLAEARDPRFLEDTAGIMEILNRIAQTGSGEEVRESDLSSIKKILKRTKKKLLKRTEFLRGCLKSGKIVVWQSDNPTSLI